MNRRLLIVWGAAPLQLKCQGRPVEVQVILLTHAVIFCQKKDERLVVKVWCSCALVCHCGV